MAQTPNRSSLSRRVLQAASSFKAMLFRRLFRSSIYESIRPVLRGRMGWLETLSSLIGRGSQDIHRGGVLRVSAKERAKRSAAREFRRRFVMAEQLELRALMAADLGLDPTSALLSDVALVSTIPGQNNQSSVTPVSHLRFDQASTCSPSELSKLDAAIAQVNTTLKALVNDGRFATVVSQAFELKTDAVQFE